MKFLKSFLKLSLVLVYLVIFADPLFADPSESEKNHIQRFEFISPVYHIDKIYKSMQGPSSRTPIFLNDSNPPELLWITSYKSEMVGADGKTPMSNEFMCHSNLDFNLAKRSEAFGQVTNEIKRIATLSQGQYSVNFPEGFGIPIMSNESLNLETQVLNLNTPKINTDVRHKVTIEYIRDADTTVLMKALFTAGAQGLVLVEGDNPYYGVEHADPSIHGEGCAIGATATNAQARYRDESGNLFTGHWVVKPGREVNTTLATKFINLPFDTTIHYIAVHLHPFAETLELRDRTTGESLFKSTAENLQKGIGLNKVDYYSSPEGIQVRKDHEYEIISTYNNVTSENQDAMAVMVLFLEDKNFKKPDLSLSKK